MTDRENGVLRTFSLAFYVTATAYTPGKKAAGMIHVVLPASPDAKNKYARPICFAETGVPLLADTLC